MSVTYSELQIGDKISEENYRWAKIDGQIYKVGDILECIKAGAKHGLTGHRLQIASIRPQGHEIWFWCHGFYKINNYNHLECLSLKEKYPYGNFGVNPYDRKLYKITCVDWDN